MIFIIQPYGTREYSDVIRQFLVNFFDIKKETGKPTSAATMGA